MRQSTIIFGSIMFAFVVYITLRGQMPAYLALFSSSKSAAKSQASSSPTSSKGLNEQADAAIAMGQKYASMFNLGNLA